MGKEEAKKKRLAEAEKERLELLQKKMENAGLNFVDHELPPDEIDDEVMDQTKKSIWASFKSMIPYTSEWYESFQAEDEMDNFSRIKIEKAKANDLLAMTKVGRHEEALEMMMSETNNDFFFFNKLKFKMEEEGKWDYKEPQLDPFGSLSKGTGRNRIKKAMGAQYSILSAQQQADMKKATRSLGNVGGEDVKKLPRKDAPCIWRGKTKQGELLNCSNIRMFHPTEKVTDPETGEPARLMLKFCAYHVLTCVEVHED
jgi:hypothetical protein